MIREVFQDDASDFKITEERLIYFVCYKTIPVECWLVHGQLDIKYGTFGVLNSRAGYLRPEKHDYESYLFKYAELQLQALKKLCLSILPDKYLELYKSGFQIINVPRINLGLELDLKIILQEIFATEISNISTDESIVNFIIHESICFALKIESSKIILQRQLIRGYSIILLELEYNEANFEYIVSFIRSYSDSIIPEEWLLTFQNC